MCEKSLEQLFGRSACWPGKQAVAVLRSHGAAAVRLTMVRGMGRAAAVPA